MAGQKDYLITFTLIFIFSIAMMYFAIGFSTEQGAGISIADDSEIGSAKANSQTSMTSFRIESNGSLTAFDQASIDEASQSGTLVTGSEFKQINKNPISVFTNMMNLAFIRIFGGDSNFTIILDSILVLVGVISMLLIWKTWKGGNPE